MTEEQLERLKKLRDIQKESVVNAYDAGLYNGMELAIALVEERDPKYFSLISNINKWEIK